MYRGRAAIPPPGCGRQVVLAYVFWHAPAADCDLAAYETLLVRFHEALAADRSAGFISSFSTRTSRLPWLDAGVAYEDWYLLESSAALDGLAAAAVDALRRGVHDEAARAARTGIAGLYRLVTGELIVPVHTVWFAKPDGTSYADFEPILDATSRSGATIWQRQMVLGPTPEYAAQTRTASDVGAGGVAHFALQPKRL